MSGKFLTRGSPRAHQETAILTIHQLPDSRRAILTALKQTGSATIAQLAEQLQLTGEAVRQQLLQLQRDGWIEARVDRAPERGRTGRPATTYTLTAAGDHLFPKEYDALNVAMFDAIGDELGPDAMRRVLRRLTDDDSSAFRVVAESAKPRIHAGWSLQSTHRGLSSLALRCCNPKCMEAT